MTTEYLRVTDILFPFSGLTKVDPLILKNAADRGSKVHAICNAVIDSIGIPDALANDPKVMPYVESFKQWYKENMQIERPERFFCNDLLITGECDGLYLNKDKTFTLYDLKTSAKESQTWALQGSAYVYLARKHGYKIGKIQFIKLSKTGDKPVVFEYEYNFDLFLKCLELYRYFFSNSKRYEEIDLI